MGKSRPARDTNTIQENHFTAIPAMKDLRLTKNKNILYESPMRIKEFLNFAISVSATLDKLHKKNHIHGDIRPENIRWEQESLKIEMADAVEATLYGATRLPYISPEQTGRMNRKLDYRTDLYSLGITFYQLLTARLPFVADDFLEMIHSHIARRPIPPNELRPEIPKQVSAIVMQLLKKNAEDRYQSASGLKHDLQICVKQYAKGGDIESFELGKSDFLGVFLIPQKLYGREEELNSLLKSFNRICAGTTELILVKGYSGIGKTALVHELYKPITEKRGYFIEGKFDQYQRNIPYFAWGQVFDRLTNHFLIESEAQLVEWKTQILDAVGLNGKVLTDFIPKLELVIGPQPEVPELGGQEAQNRFNFIFQGFIKVIARKDHPLVVFLDDLQWIDAASLHLLNVLLTDLDSAYLMVIGAYRDNEVDASHPLIIQVAEWQKINLLLNQLTIQNLTEDDVNALIADTLRMTYQESQSLMKLIYSKTIGNAFFIHQILHALYNEKLLIFDEATYSWQYDMGALQEMNITDNVVELLIRKVQKLPNPTQEVLKLAACIGNQFDISILTILCQKSTEALNADLQISLSGNILLPVKDFYKFAHDRVQQAAYALIQESEKNSTHLKIGRLLLQNIPVQEREERIFEIVTQLNKAQVLIDHPDEKTKLAELNLLAAKRARSSQANAQALQYTQSGIKMLAPESWDQQYELTLDLYIELHECLFLTTDFEGANRMFEQIKKRARRPEEIIRPIYTTISQYTMIGNYDMAIHTGIDYLKEFGIDIPDNPSLETVMEELQDSNEQLTKRSLEDLLYSSSQVPGSIEIEVSIFSSLTGAAFFARPFLLLLIGLRSVTLALKYGICKGMVSGMAVVPTAYIMLEDNYKKGYDFGRSLVKVGRNTPYNKYDLGTALHDFGIGTQHWKERLRNVVNTAKEAYLHLRSSGDVMVAGYTFYTELTGIYDAGEPLENTLGKSQEVLSFLLKTKDKHAWGSLIIYQQLALCMMGKTRSIGNFDSDKFSEKEHLDSLGDNKMGICYYHIYKTQALYFFGQASKALIHSEAATKLLEYIPTFYLNVIYNLYYSLSLCQLARLSSSEKEKTKLLSRVDQNQKQMKSWAQDAPMNFQHKYDLVEAEKARTTRQLEVTEWYEKAIKGAKENQFIHEEALAYKLAAEFYLECEMDEIGQFHLLKAHNGFSKWQAWAIIKQLEDSYPQWLTPTSDLKKEHTAYITGQEILDLNTVIKASRAIAGEIMLDKLLTKMMHIVIENAAAQKGYLLMERNGNWVIEATGNFASSEVQVLQSLKVEGSNTVSAGVIYYVVRTQESVVLSDAAHEGDFKGDPEIQHHQSKSVLCTPLINQGQISGILYLENNLTAGAFTSERLELLNLISSQMAMALDNAKLYADLEKSEEKFRGVFNSMTDVFTRSDKNGICLIISPSIYKILGYKPEEILGKNFADFYADPNQRNEIVNELQNTNEVKNYNIDLIKKDGKTITVSTNTKMYYDSQGESLGIEGNLRDITESKLAEAKLQESEEKFRTLVTNTEELIYIIAKDGTFLLSEGKGLSKLGLEPGEVVGKSVFDLYKDYPAMLDKMRQALKGETVVGELKVDNNYFKNWYTPQLDQNGEIIGLLGLSINITEQKNAELKVLEHQSRLKDLANKLVISEEEIRKQIAVDLHDNVGQLLSSSRMQLAKVIDLEENPEIAIRAKNISQVLLKSIRATREAIFNLSPPQLNDVGLYAAVHGWMQEHIERRYDISTGITGEHEMFNLDDNTRLLTFRSIRELITNVLKHARADHLKVDFKIKGEMLEIAVEDDGVGFNYSPELLKLKSDSYGLFSIQERLFNLGGYLTIDSVIDKGTKAKLLVPLKDKV